MILYPESGASGSPKLVYPNGFAPDPGLTYLVHLQENLERDLGPVFKDKPNWLPCAYWVCSAINIRRYIDHHADPETFVPLASQYASRYVPKNARAAIFDRLKKAGVIECDNIYYFNRYFDGGAGKCYCYRMGEAYRGVPIRGGYVFSPELRRRADAAWADERDEITDPLHIILRRWHDQVELLSSTPFGLHPLTDRMLDGERRFKACKQGRLHTNAANLPVHCRQFIRVAGRELEAVDIRNSQPLILGITLLKEAQGRFKKTKPVLSPSSDTSLSDYMEACLSGELYERVAERLPPDKQKSREELKPGFMTVLFGHPSQMGTVIGKALHERYPAVFEGVQRLAGELGKGGLARKMQRIESDIMIRRVAGRMVREHPEMPILTVHDCVAVPGECVEKLERVIAEEWHAECGISPRTKRFSFTAPAEPRPKRAPRPKPSKKYDPWKYHSLAC